jgi:predicted transcriptional regulator
VKNFHLPLPDETYDQLRAIAKRSDLPATAIARQAIDGWLRQQKRIERDAELKAFIDACAGTKYDLDPDLEAAGIDVILKTTDW